MQYILFFFEHVQNYKRQELQQYQSNSDSPIFLVTLGCVDVGGASSCLMPNRPLSSTSHPIDADCSGSRSSGGEKCTRDVIFGCRLPQMLRATDPDESPFAHGATLPVPPVRTATLRSLRGFMRIWTSYKPSMSAHKC